MSYRILIASMACAGSAAAQTQPPAPPLAPSTFASMQWLYGSGEGAATGIQAYRAFTSYVVATAGARPNNSVVLTEASTLEEPHFIPCEDRPLAVVLDVDETAIQNLGYEYDRDVRSYGYGERSWDRWEKKGGAAVAPMPGAVDALRAIRAANVTVIFNTNRLADNARANEDTLNNAGLGPVSHATDLDKRTLWLLGDVAAGSPKDPRRREISKHYCVIAMAGDQLGDFSDLFNRGVAVPDRRRFASSPPFAGLWGSGWFMLSNPVYGTAMAGTRNEVFPDKTKRWLDPEGAVVE